MRQTCIAQIAKPAVMSSSLYSAKQIKKKKIQLTAVEKRGESGAMALRNTLHTFISFLLDKTRAKTAANLRPLFSRPATKQQGHKRRVAPHSPRVVPSLRATVVPPTSRRTQHTDFTRLRHNLENSGEGETERKGNTTEKKREDSFFLKSVPGSSVPRPHVITPLPFRCRSP